MVQSQNSQETETIDALLLVIGHWRLIALFTLCCTVIVSLATFLLHDQYIAESVVMPPNQPSSASAALMSQLGGGSLGMLASGGLGIKNPGDMYVSMFETRGVADAITRRFNLQQRYGNLKHLEDTRKALAKHVSIALGAKDGLIRISVRDTDPKMAADIANGYVEEFKKQSDLIALSEALQRRNFYEQQLNTAKSELSNAEQDLERTQQQTGIVHVDSQSKALIEAVAELRAQISAKQVYLRGLRTYSTENNPEYIVANQELAELEAQQNKLGGSGHGEDADLIPSKEDVPKLSLEYMQKLRVLKYDETLYELLGKQYEFAKLDEAREGNGVEVVDRAVAPDKPSSPERLLIAVMTAAFSLFLSVFYVVASARFIRFAEHYNLRERFKAAL